MADVEFREGCTHAADMLRSVLGMPAAFFEKGALDDVLANLERSAQDMPIRYAAGMLSTLGRVRRELQRER